MMDIGAVRGFLGSDWSRYESEFVKALDSSTDMLNQINERIVANSGKQLRPMLSLLVSRACGVPNDVSYHCAVASELIHTATLLHDDVADNSSMRRGKPTIMSLFGPSVSVLIGDFWLSRAMGLLVDSARHEIIGAFSLALGELAEGEILQMQKAAACDTSMDDYLKIISCKTGALFRASMLSAAYSVSASPETIKAIRNYASDLGTAFQMQDDIFDYKPDMSVGKNLGVDLLERKITLPLLEALASVSEDEQERVRRLVMEIDGKPGNRDEVISFVAANSGVEKAVETLGKYCRMAASRLDILPDSTEKEMLRQLAFYVGSRTK